MAKTGKPTIEELKLLCDYSNGLFISKRGDDYIEALGRLFSLVNRNDKPFTIEDIRHQTEFKDFLFAGVLDYRYICDLEATPMTINASNLRTNEKIHPKRFAGPDEQSIFDSALGVSYIITCLLDGKEYMIKIGSSRKTFKARLQSYNCGCVYNWRTASTTNIKILQSMVTTRAVFKLYIYDCSADVYVIDWRGVRSAPFASPKALAVEDIMVKKFIEQFGIKPLANVQADAEG